MIRGRPRRVAALVACGAFAVAVGACGVETESEPNTLRADDVPFGLLDPSAPTTTSTTPSATTLPSDEVEIAQIPVFFLAPAGLTPFSVEVAAAPTPQRRLDALFAGPLAEWRALGVRSAVPPVLDRITVRRQGATALVELSEEFLDALTQNSASPALAQIVYTLTAAKEVARVSFLNDGSPIDVVRPDGTPVRRPVTRADFPRALLVT